MRKLQFILLLLILPSMGLVGLQSYEGFSEDAGSAPAQVDGHAITQAEWDSAHRDQVEQMRRKMIRGKRGTVVRLKVIPVGETAPKIYDIVRDKIELKDAEARGEVIEHGAKADGTPWRVGIRHPRREDAAVAGFDLAAGALATSGDYERYFDIGGRRYCHIMNPRTGMPVSHWQSISVVSPLCVVAGSCATIAMLLENGAAAFLDAQGVQWLGVAADGALQGPASNA